MTDPSRRTVLAGLATLASLGASPGDALAQIGPATARPDGFGGPFSSVSVDVAPLLARGLGLYAEYVRSALTAELRRAFADRIGGPGPRLVVRINGLSLNSFAGSGQSGGGRRGGLGGGTDNDYLDGEALVVGRRGEVLAARPQLSALPASSGGPWYDPASEQRRVLALAQHYAWWLRRALAG